MARALSANPPAGCPFLPRPAVHEKHLLAFVVHDRPVADDGEETGGLASHLLAGEIHAHGSGRFFVLKPVRIPPDASIATTWRREPPRREPSTQATTPARPGRAGSPGAATWRARGSRASGRTGDAAIENRDGSSTAVSRCSSPKRRRIEASAVGRSGTCQRTRRRSWSRCGVIRTG